MRTERNDARAHRILDVAGELLMRWGYDRVTVGEIARRAEIGKGTLYLHWKTKDELIATLLLRDLASVLDQIVRSMSQDCAEVLLHRVIRRLFLTSMGRPLCKALLTGDDEVLGKFATVSTPMLRRCHTASRRAREEYLRLLTANDLFRPEPDPRVSSYALDAAVTGFFLLERPDCPEEHPVPLPARADALAGLIARTFEPTRVPDDQVLAPVAGEAARLFEQTLAVYLDAVPGPD